MEISLQAQFQQWFRFPPWFHCLIRRGAYAALLVAVSGLPVAASGISGSLSNFDVFNDTPTNAYGAELELEGNHANDVSATYPSHYDSKSIVEYSDGVKFRHADHVFWLQL